MKGKLRPKIITQDEVNEYYRKKLLTPPEAASLLNVSRQGVWAFIKYKKLPTIKVEGQIYIESDIVRQFALDLKKKFLDKAAAIRLPDEF